MALQSEAAIRNGSALRELETRNLSLDTDSSSLTEGELLYLNFISRLQWCEQKWRHNRLKQFAELKKSEGWEVNPIPCDLEAKRAGAELLKIATDPMGNKKYTRILEAENLSDEEFEELRSVPTDKLTQSEKLAMKKYNIANLFGMTDVRDLTLKQIDDYFVRNFCNVLRDVKLLRNSRDDAMKFDRVERENK
jgi:hypothetical protein